MHERELKRRLREAKADLWAKAEEHGYSVCAVMGGPDSMSFAYTIGLTTFQGHPELIVFGLGGQAKSHLDGWVKRIRSGTRFDKEARLVDELAGQTRRYDLYVLPADAAEAAEYFRMHPMHAPLEAVQLIIPDPQNLFPWEPGAVRGYAPPLLGHVTPVEGPAPSPPQH